MENVYQQFIERMDGTYWDLCEKESIDDFNNLTGKFGKELHDAIQSMAPGQELFQLDKEDEDKYCQTENEKMNFYERKF